MYPFNLFSQDMLNHFLPGQRAMQDILTSGDEAVESVIAPGAFSLAKAVTEVSIDGTDAFTLAAPTYPGQMKTVVVVAAANTPAGTLTVSSPDDTTGFVCPATFFLNTVGQRITFRATSAKKWRCVEKVRAGIVTLTVGTTTTTGIADMQHINLSVTGTVASTTTKALPNGAAVGELCAVTCSTAASTPHGDLGGTFLTKTGTAGTALDDFTSTADQALLMWNGSAWQPISLSGTALAVV